MYLQCDKTLQTLLTIRVRVYTLFVWQAGCSRNDVVLPSFSPSQWLVRLCAAFIAEGIEEIVTNTLKGAV